VIDRAKMLQILVESNRRSLIELGRALEELETGVGNRGSYATLQRAFHTIKSDARAVGLERLALFSEGCERIVENASDRGLGLPIDLLREAAEEIRAATETVAAGGRHRLDQKLVARVKEAARPAPVG
jgi:HPt (histidine-containing phosphotransfer) domain-containing protein